MTSSINVAVLRHDKIVHFWATRAKSMAQLATLMRVCRITGERRGT